MPGDWVESVSGLHVAVPPDPKPGLALLEILRAEVEAAASPDDAVKLLAALLQDAERMEAVLVAWRASRDAATGILTLIGNRRGLKGHADKLVASLKASAKEREIADKRDRIHLVAPNEPLLSLTVALEGWEGLPPDLTQPPGYRITTDGVVRVQHDPETFEERVYPVASQAILITGWLENIEDGKTFLRLEWGTPEEHRFLVIPRVQGADVRQIVALADDRAPVHSGNAGELVFFLAAFEAHNRDALPFALVTGVMGWQGRDGQRGFMWGRHNLTAEGQGNGMAVEDLPPSAWTRDQVHLLVETGAAEVADAFRAAGTWEGWLGVAAEALPYPIVLLGVYASLVPPLMPFVPGLPNFIIDWSGTTSTGKTTLLRLAASVWGSPDERGGGLVYSWDCTRVWVERTSHVLQNLILILDDTKRARKPREVGQTLYDIANGIGRGRGAQKGTRTSARWRTVCLSSGEAPATSFTEDGGTRSRTICIWSSPFGVADETTGPAVARINQGVLKHHGHAGPRMIAWLQESPDRIALVREKYDEALIWWTGKAAGNPVAGRAAQYLAILTVARNILHEVLGVPVPVQDPLVAAWAAVIEAAGDADRATEAFRDVLSWATGQQARFYGRLSCGSGTDEAPSGGWLGAWPNTQSWAYIGFLPSELTLFLQKQGYDTEAILRTWNDRGWIHGEDEKHRTRKLMVGTRKQRCIVITRAAHDEVEGSDDE